ncbi:MAG: hypothetical protein EOP56_02745 [Sphingobacteriales bacterium]|nr:MAG: hypothetical protein EOP56_02745 [Sphingobacteriales bacterium]
MEMTEKMMGQLQRQLHELEKEQLNIMCFSKRSLVLANQTMSELKDWLREHPFQSNEEEIRFFKEIKPRFSALVIYHSEVLRVETYRPLGKDKMVKKYLVREMERLKEHAEQHRDFYRYHLTAETYLDDKYFLRDTDGRQLDTHILHPDYDLEYSTVHSHLMATIIAHTRLQTYLEEQLVRLTTEECKQSFIRKLSDLKLVWTGPKAALIELMYGLQTSGVFNEAKADIKQIAAVFESVFNIELGDYYRTYQAIRIRKKNRTSFIDGMRDNLVQRMDDADDRSFMH